MYVVVVFSLLANPFLRWICPCINWHNSLLKTEMRDIEKYYMATREDDLDHPLLMASDGSHMWVAECDGKVDGNGRTHACGELYTKSR